VQQRTVRERVAGEVEGKTKRGEGETKEIKERGMGKRKMYILWSDGRRGGKDGNLLVLCLES
jgi:hypothetical protein